jgi:hypothetical protein
MDPDLGRYPEIWAAAGHDGSVFPVSPAALRALTNAIVAEIAEIVPPDPGTDTNARRADPASRPPRGHAAPGT